MTLAASASPALYNAPNLVEMNERQHARLHRVAGVRFGSELRCCYCTLRAACHCYPCDRPGSIATIDHRIPASRGGTDAEENLAVACRLCNTAKGARLYPDEWFPGVARETFLVGRSPLGCEEPPIVPVDYALLVVWDQVWLRDPTGRFRVDELAGWLVAATPAELRSALNRLAAIGVTKRTVETAPRLAVVWRAV